MRRHRSRVGSGCSLPVVRAFWELLQPEKPTFASGAPKLQRQNDRNKMGEDDPIKERLLQRALDPTVRVALDSISPSCVTLEVTFTVTYETEPGVNFHVGFNLLDKNYDAGYVSTWEVLKTVSLPELQLPPASARGEKSPQPLRVQISKAVTTFGGGPVPTTTLQEAGLSSSPPAAGSNTFPVAIAEKSEEIDVPRSQVVTATSTVAVEGVTISWALCQRIANEVLIVCLGRKRDGSLDQAPKGSPNSVCSQREGTAPSKRGAGRSESGMNANAGLAKEKGKPKSSKEVKALPVFEMHRQGQMRIGSLLLLSEAGSIKSCPSLNQAFATLDGIHRFELEVSCSQAPLSTALRELVNPVCITFCNARRIPVSVLSSSTNATDVLYDEPASSGTDRGIGVGASTTDGASSDTRLLSACCQKTKLAAHAAAQWFPNISITTPVRALSFSGFCADGIQCADVSWNHDIVVFWGPAVVNQIALRRFLEDFAFTVELHDQDTLAIQSVDGVNASKETTLEGHVMSGSTSSNAGTKRGRASSPGTVAGSRTLSPTISKVAPLSACSQGGASSDTSKELCSAPITASPRGTSLTANASHRKTKVPSPGRPEPPGTKSKHRMTKEDDFDGGSFEARIIRPHGAANFRFQELLRHGLKRIELASAVYPVLGTGGVPVLEQTTLLKDQSASQLLAQPDNYLTRFMPGKTQHVSTRYLDYGTQLMLRVRLSEPLPSIEKIQMLHEAGQQYPKEAESFPKHDGEQEATPGNTRELQHTEADPALRYEPFGCLVLFVKPDRKPLIQKIVMEVDRRNMQAMNVETRDALSLEILPADEEGSNAHDVLTGFILFDEKSTKTKSTKRPTNARNAPLRKHHSGDR
ncbi:hypothetical protein TGRUB_205140 [Toxoplasma gondii RUB]|uniref:Uncharacterized protein n=1 Tax=Toxoplasma gondii RUB TaxID=935652 RepID=A0A086LRA1_TOXGO|nr:hypothetical protein TGRUB_205140 [Toxoplasma gondii RUB]